MGENGQAAVLAAIDAALAAGHADATDPDERAAQELALAVAAEAPAPDADFVRELDAWVASGFDGAPAGAPGSAGTAGTGDAAGARPSFRRFGSAGRPRRRLALPARRPLLAAGAFACVVLVAAVATGAALLDSGEPAGDAVSPRPAASPESAPSPQSATAERAPAPSAGGAGPEELQGRLASPAPARRVERSAELTLAAPDDELEHLSDEVIEVTDRHRGVVLRSSVSTGSGELDGGRLELRVPAAALQAALRDLSKLAHVESRTQAAEDRTDAFVSAGDRLDAALAERRSLLRRLSDATTDADAEALRRRLDRNGLRIAELRRAVAGLRTRTDFATIAVTLAERRHGAAAPGPTRRAFDDGLDLLVGSLAFAQRALGVLIPLGIAAGLGALGAAALRRHRREAVLR